MQFQPAGAGPEGGRDMAEFVRIGTCIINLDAIAAIEDDEHTVYVHLMRVGDMTNTLAFITPNEIAELRALFADTPTAARKVESRRKLAHEIAQLNQQVAEMVQR